MSEIKLLPCPFCGGEAKISINKSSQGQVGIVECMKCSCRKTMLKYPFYEGNIEKDIADSWNTRKSIDRIVEQLERQIYLNSYEPVNLGWNKAIRKAIKLVKAGGKSESL